MKVEAKRCERRRGINKVDQLVLVGECGFTLRYSVLEIREHFMALIQMEWREEYGHMALFFYTYTL